MDISWNQKLEKCGKKEEKEVGLGPGAPRCSPGAEPEAWHRPRQGARAWPRSAALLRDGRARGESGGRAPTRRVAVRLPRALTTVCLLE